MDVINIMIWVVLVILALLLMVAYHRKVVEGWQDYVMQPFGYVKTGRDPLYFYPMPRYREPYRWPFRFYKSYPYPHMAPFA